MLRKIIHTQHDPELVLDLLENLQCKAYLSNFKVAGDNLHRQSEGTPAP
jgi:hypothetical protein